MTALAKRSFARRRAGLAAISETAAWRRQEKATWRGGYQACGISGVAANGVTPGGGRRRGGRWLGKKATAAWAYCFFFFFFRALRHFHLSGRLLARIFSHLRR
jgi:hypothetical protein